MAVTIVEHPQTFAYADNSIPVIFDVGQTAAVSAILCDASQGTPSQGATIKFYFDDEVVEFTYNYSTFQDFYNDVASNYIIRTYFNAVFNTNQFTLTAYENDDLGIVVDVSANFTPCSVTITQGGMDEIRVLLGIDIWNGLIFKPTKFDKSHKVASDGKASFNLAPAFPFPDFAFGTDAFNGFYPFITEAIKYRLRYAEQLPTGTGQIHFTSSPLYALNGGFSEYYRGSMIHPDNFLTASPRYIISRDDEPRFLSVLATADINNCEIRVIAYDFTDTAHVINKPVSNMTAGQLQHIPVSYFALDLASHANAPFYKYTLEFISVYASNGQTSEMMTIECDRSVVHNYATFLFTNSRGGIDTIAFLGDTEETTDFSKLALQRTTGEGLYELRSQQHRLAYSFKQYTGYYDDYDRFCYLEELFNAAQVWIWRDGEAVPIEITSNDFEKGNPLDTVWSAEFEFTLKHNDVAADLKFATKVTAVTTPPIVITPPPTVDHYEEPTEDLTE